MANNHAILLRLADLAGLALIVIAIDLRYFFHQFLFQASVAWRMGALVPTVVDGAVAWRFALEYVMSMGAHPSSRVAQRFAN